VTIHLHEFLSQDRHWQVVASIVDELLAHEHLDGEQVHEIVSRWL
jgi:hypothetical protein